MTRAGFSGSSPMVRCSTIATEMLAPLKKVAAELGGEGRPRLLAVTGSDEGQRRSDVDVVSWRRFATELGRGKQQSSKQQSSK